LTVGATDGKFQLVTSNGVAGGGDTARQASLGLSYGTSGFASRINFNRGAAGTDGSMAFEVNKEERLYIDSIGRTVSSGIQHMFGHPIHEVRPNANTIRLDCSNWNYGAYIDITHKESDSTDALSFARFVYNTVGIGHIDRIGKTGVAYNTTSDYRLKENIAPMTGALTKVAQLKPCTYTWKVDGSSGQGFIAHELQAIVPEAVTGVKDAVETVDDLDAEGRKIGTKEIPKHQGIDTSFLVATLTAAIQEQQAIITDLKSRIEVLENK
jgi:hypothetical protein